MSKLLERAVEELAKLPGIGDRTALRLALHLLRQPAENVQALTAAVDAFRMQVKHCSQCNNISDEDICPVCADASRDRSVICVVEQVKDVLSIENTGQYNGLYHVLGGIISPMQGIAPSDLKIDLLVGRIAAGGVGEVILALNTSIEGETTAYYITKKLEGLPVRITAIARGIGFGDEIDYADEITLVHALHNRRAM